MSDPNTLVATAAALEPLDRLVFEVCVIAGTGTTRTRMVKIVKALSRRMPSGSAWNTKVLAAPLERLNAAGLIDVRHAVDPHLRHTLGRHLLATGRLDELAHAAEAGLESEHLARVHLFVAWVHEDDASGVDAWEACRAEGWPCPLTDILPKPLAPSTVAALPPALQDRLFREVFGPDHTQRDLDTCAGLLDVLKAHCAGPEASELVRARCAEQLLWAWRHEEATELLAPLRSPLAKALEGWLALARGDAKAAVERFRGAKKVDDLFLKVLRIIAHLAADGAKGAADAKKVLRSKARSRREDRYSEDPPIWTYDLEEDLDCLIRTVCGDRVDPHSWRYRPEANLAALVEGLWMLTAGHPLPERLQESLEMLRDQASRHDHGWLVAQVDLMLALARSDDTATTTLSTALEARGQCALTDLIRPTERWMKQLDDLLALRPAAPEPLPAALPTTGTERLAWSLQYRHGWLHIAPRLQKRNKKGWTGGRAVALERLYEDRDLEYLTPQDRRVLEHLECETTWSGYRNRYAETTYHFGEDAALALVGHPLLIWEGDPKRPARLTRGRPALVIEPTSAGGVVVRLDPPGSKRLAFRRPEPDHLEIVPLSDREQEIGKILDTGMVVPREAIERTREVLESVIGELPIRSSVSGWDAETVEASSDLRVHATLLPERLRVRVSVRPLGAAGPELTPGQGATTVLGRRDGKPVQTERDLGAENQAVANFLQRCPSLREAPSNMGRWSIDDPVERLAAAAELAALGDTVEWEGAPVTVAGADVEQLSIVATQDDGVSLTGKLTFEDHEVDLSSLLDMLSASPTRVLSMGGGRLLEVSEELARLLRQLAPWATSRKNALQLSPLGIAAAGALVEAAGGDANPRFEASLARLREADSLSVTPPTTLEAELRDYQEDGFRWMARLAHWAGGACLADDMGLGKTVQSLALLLHRAAEGPALVIAPTSVCPGWLSEARRFAPTLEVTSLAGVDRATTLQNLGPGSVLVCSYGLLCSEAEALAGVHWGTVVLDEAQQIKNPRTRRFKAATALNADFRLALTGTPIENRLLELWAILSFCLPGLLGSEAAFKKRWVGPVERQRDPGARRALRQLVRPFVLRRIKSEVLEELPPRTEVVLRVEPTPAEAAVYEALRQIAVDDLTTTTEDDGWRMRAFAHLTRLRLAACHPSLVDQLPESIDWREPGGSKLEALEELVQDLGEGGHRALVFSQFVRHLQRVRLRLDALGIPSQYLDGSTSLAARAKAVNAFQSGEGQVFLISLRAGGTGLNLTAADYVIHLDPWWNPAVEDQASDRAHRIGQKRPVTVYRLVAAGTIEERILDLHGRKRGLADAVLGGTDAGHTLSVEEILSLLSAPPAAS